MNLITRILGKKNQARKARIKRLKEEARGAVLPADYSPFFLTPRKKGGAK